MKDMQGKAKSWLERTFPERQIYHRSGGTVRYISITPKHQMLAAGGVALAAGWCVFATVSVLAQGPKLSARNDALDRSEAKTERWVSEANARAATAQSLLEERTEAFQSATIQMGQRLDSLKLILTGLKSPGSIDAASIRGNNSSFLMEASIEEGAPRQSRTSPVITASMETDGVRANIVTASMETAGFRDNIEQLRLETDMFLDDAEELAVERSEQARGVLQLTGVGIGRFEEQRELGGPLVEISSMSATDGMSEDDLVFNERVTKVAARLEEADFYQKLIDRLPLGMPVGVPSRETSGYGLRTDPFNRRPAFHAGMDMAAYRKAPIVAAGPGVVTWAGSRSGYGNLVEIDHGYGFKTRYGHLYSVNVKVGDEVQLGKAVGSMGTTGRSTGPHLHYEVWFRGKTYNPVNFLRAGQHVYKG
ncbi:MAG: peptidase M23 [Ponticaulis sp.]|nr:peptidase M23 [Ponticaulis sp.]